MQEIHRRMVGLANAFLHPLEIHGNHVLSATPQDIGASVQTSRGCIFLSVKSV
jgi:hypothetical protein